MQDSPSLEELIAGLDASAEDIEDTEEIQDGVSEVAPSEEVPDELKEDIIDQVEDVETGSDLQMLADIIDAGAVDEPSEFISQLQQDMSDLARMKQEVSGGPAFDPVTGDSNHMLISIDDENEMIPSVGLGADSVDDIDYTGRTPEEIIADIQQNALELLAILGVDE